jgi:hypothetical protein
MAYAHEITYGPNGTFRTLTKRDPVTGREWTTVMQYTTDDGWIPVMPTYSAQPRQTRPIVKH